MKPEPRLIRTPDDAEIVAAEWLRYLGYVDVVADPGAGADGGVDVRGSGIVGQVKATTAPVGRPVVQQIFGIAAAEGAQAVVFSLGGYTDEAVQWAEGTGVMLFGFDLQGQPTAMNSTATNLVPPAPQPIHHSNPQLSAAIDDIIRLAGDVLAASHEVLREVQENIDDERQFVGILPPGFDSLDDFLDALQSRPPEDLPETTARLERLDAAAIRKVKEINELTEVLAAYNDRLEQFTFAVDRLVRIPEAASRKVGTILQPHTNLVTSAIAVVNKAVALPTISRRLGQ